MSQVQSILGKVDVTAEDIERVKNSVDFATRLPLDAPRPGLSWWRNVLAALGTMFLFGCSASLKVNQTEEPRDVSAKDGVYVQHIATIDLHRIMRIHDTEQGIVCYSRGTSIDCVVAKDGGR